MPELPSPPAVVDIASDVFGAEDAATQLSRRIAQMRAGFDAGRARALQPPFDAMRDRVDGPPTARVEVLVFGAFGTPSSRALGDVLSHVHVQHAGTVSIAWRHHPDPIAHPRSPVLALAAEAAAARGKFWALARELLRLRHDDPVDLHAALLRAGLDPQRTFTVMSSGSGTDRILEDVASALASGVASSPALFIGGQVYTGRLHPADVSAALAA